MIGQALRLCTTLAEMGTRDRNCWGLDKGSHWLLATVAIEVWKWYWCCCRLRGFFFGLFNYSINRHRVVLRRLIRFHARENSIQALSVACCRRRMIGALRRLIFNFVIVCRELAAECMWRSIDSTWSIISVTLPANLLHVPVPFRPASRILSVRRWIPWRSLVGSSMHPPWQRHCCRTR